jgi:hypothetical protein
MQNLEDKPLRQGNIVHHLPGRLRIKVMGTQASPDFYLGLKDAIASVSGVDKVRVNRRSSSIVVDYFSKDIGFHTRLQNDPQVKSKLSVMDLQGLTSVIYEPVAESFVYPEQHSRIAESIVSVVEEIDNKLRQASNGYLDLKVLLPTGIAIATSLNKARARGTPMWLSLGTFAFNTFLTLHHNRIDMPYVQIFTRKYKRP